MKARPATPASGPVPILVFGSGQRCGSTLIQRLASSHPDVLIWGEHGGHLRQILAASEVITAWDAGVSEPARDDFAAKGYEGWMANLLPGPEAVANATRAYIEQLFAAPAAEHGCARWGFKEVRFGFDEAKALRELFSETRVFHVTRDPRAVLTSLEDWERTDGWWRREFTEQAIRDWVRVNESFLNARKGERDWVKSWRLEDVAADHDALVADVADLLEVEPAQLDRSLLKQKAHGYREYERDLVPFEGLPRDLRRLLRDSDVQSVAHAYGYEL